MRRVFVIASLLVVVGVVVGSVGCSSGPATPATSEVGAAPTPPAPTPTPVPPAPQEPAEGEAAAADPPPASTTDRLFVIETDHGRIVIEPMPDRAPRHVERFFTLADRGFYDGCTFHRVIPGFMIQGGDPHSKNDDLSDDGTGGSDLPNLIAEFSDVPHVPGIVSTARRGHPDPRLDTPNTGNCQFFIMHGTNPGLDGKYTVWGRVLEGMDVVDKIANLPRNPSDNPGKAGLMRRVYGMERSQYQAPAPE